MAVIRKRITQRERRHRRARKKVFGTTHRPRLSVRRSLKNLFVQLIDDSQGKTLVSASTLDSDFRSRSQKGGNKEAAGIIGELIAQKAKAKGIERAVFDRGGYAYHGRIKTVAEAARKGGLQF